MLKNPKYFDIDKFADSIIKAMKMEDADTETLDEIRRIIAQRLHKNIVIAILNSFGKKELIRFENMLEDHPEIEEIDALFIVANDIEGLEDKITAAIDELFDEFLYTANVIDKNLAQTKANAEKRALASKNPPTATSP